MITKRKKNTRQRGSKTHGWGSRKKHRNAGNRGGVGMAGSGKRGDAKKETVLKIKDYFGKHGFTTKRRNFVISVNVAYLEEKFASLIKQGKAKDENGIIMVDLSDLGADKLLAKGMATRKYKITCSQATERAVKAIEAAGGSVEQQNL